MQHPDLTVTSEEKVLNAILLWCLRATEFHGWEVVEEMTSNSTPELLFGERLQSVNDFLPLVRFPLLPLSLLKKVGFVICGFLELPVLKLIIIFCYCSLRVVSLASRFLHLEIW